MRCKKCIWGSSIAPKKVYCLFTSCVKKVKTNAQKTQEALLPPRGAGRLSERQGKPGRRKYIQAAEA